jgi:hypothetical protein
MKLSQTDFFFSLSLSPPTATQPLCSSSQVRMHFGGIEKSHFTTHLHLPCRVGQTAILHQRGSLHIWTLPCRSIWKWGEFLSSSHKLPNKQTWPLFIHLLYREIPVLFKSHLQGQEEQKPPQVQVPCRFRSPRWRIPSLFWSLSIPRVGDNRDQDYFESSSTYSTHDRLLLTLSLYRESESEDEDVYYGRYL